MSATTAGRTRTPTPLGAFSRPEPHRAAHPPLRCRPGDDLFSLRVRTLFVAESSGPVGPPHPTRPTAVVVVTYERPPSPGLWPSLTGAVDLLVVADNSTSAAAQAEVERQCRSSPVPCELVQSRANLGIARALNAGVAVARRHGCETVVLLDDDAVVPPDFFRAEREVLEQLERVGSVPVGAVLPVVTDLSPSLHVPSFPRPWVPVGTCITSGTLLRLTVFDAVGGFDESLFVDGVDVDFARRVRASGRVLVRVNTLVLHQQFGRALPAVSLRLRLIERAYALAYLAGLLVGRSNSFHTRLCRYTLARRTELARSVRPAAPEGSRPRPGAGVGQRLGVLATLLIDSLTTGDWNYVRLAFPSS